MRNSRGFSLIEVLVSVAIFVLVSTTIYIGYGRVMEVVRLGRMKTLAAQLADEQLEIVRNLPYESVGLQGGLPSGVLQPVQTLVRDGVTFYATTTVRNRDDSFDGTVDGTPNDTSPADYKLVAVTIGCPSCTDLQMSTVIAPKGLETASNNGALFVKAFDANGNPIQGAQVHIQNSSTSPTITIDDLTDVNGMLQIVDAPTSSESYQITVAKGGYSTDRTYPPRATDNPNPVLPHATVQLQQVTQVSFAIDHLSTLAVSSVDTSCQPVPLFPFNLTGTKLIGTSPNVIKFPEHEYTTDVNGSTIVSDLEWDTYSLGLTDTTRYVAGISPLFPFAIQPNNTTHVQIITTPKVPGAVLFSVRDAASELPLTGATVELSLHSYDTTKTTGQGLKYQTDWSGGSGQDVFSDDTKYASSDGNIEDSDFLGSLKLKNVSGSYVTDGSLVSSTFDLGATSTFYQISWQPQGQPETAGTSAVRFQIAANNDNSTWNFVGPDGTAETYYTTSGENISSTLNGSRFVRYKIFLHTDDITVTPIVSDIFFDYNSPCTPSGQVYFDGLTEGTYTVLVKKSGYQDISTTASISGSGYLDQTISMTP